MTDDKAPVNRFRAKQKRKKKILTITVSALSVAGLAIAGSLIGVTVANSNAVTDVNAQVGLDQNVKNISLEWDYQDGARKDLLDTPTGDWTIDADGNPGFTSVEHPGCLTKWLSPASPPGSDTARDDESTTVVGKEFDAPGVVHSSTWVNFADASGSLEFATSSWTDEETGNSVIAYYRDMPDIQKMMLVQLTCGSEEELTKLTGGQDNLNPITDYGVALKAVK